MLNVKTPEEVIDLLKEGFPKMLSSEEVPLSEALGRVLAEEIRGEEYVPGFDRSTVDGYALMASDTFGCSDSLPAILKLRGEVLMGKEADFELNKGECAYVPTGGALPKGADSVVMIEYSEDYKDGTIGILKSTAPGSEMIFKGDDVYPGKEILPKGRKLSVSDIGALAAMGITSVKVMCKPLVGIISTGDELVDIDVIPREGQVRDINSSLLAALIKEAGGRSVAYGIVKDEEKDLRDAIAEALKTCDLVLISGGSSAGMKDMTCALIEEFGEVLLHGIAMKPGKPTILGKADDKAVFGLPGHPVAAYFVSELFVRPLLAQMMGRKLELKPIKAELSEAISANHGRAQYMGVRLSEENGILHARPIHGKSGLISSLAGSDGYFCIPRDREGVAAGEMIEVYVCSVD